mmetsp:Transcript_67671/g.102002  ORF Transcript_67671/g.102002 Transcript_67671/m.102002 type:complete len:293 (+) Transcript_67671:514-1392(+)
MAYIFKGKFFLERIFWLDFRKKTSSQKLGNLDRYYAGKIFGLFFKTRLEQSLGLKNCGLKFSPFLLKKFFSASRRAYIKKFQQVFFDQNLINRYHSKVPLLKYPEKGERIQNQIPKFSNNLKKNSILVNFEETADEIKVYLTPNLIKRCISKNFLLGRSWLTIKPSPRRNEEFWYSYISSCYNFMTKFQNSRESKWMTREINGEIFGPKNNNSDREFFLAKLDSKKFTSINCRITEKQMHPIEEENIKKIRPGNNTFLGRWRSRTWDRKIILFHKNKILNKKNSFTIFLLIG